MTAPSDVFYFLLTRS